MDIPVSAINILFSVLRLDASGKLAERQSGYDGGSSGLACGGSSWVRMDPEDSEPQHVRPV
jgi:hypothetical protein